MKFKKGDLVMLSAAGRNRSGNWRCREGFGFVKKVHRPSTRMKYPIKVEWWDEDMDTFEQPFKLYELKKMRKKDK